MQNQVVTTMCCCLRVGLQSLILRKRILQTLCLSDRCRSPCKFWVRHAYTDFACVELHSPGRANVELGNHELCPCRSRPRAENTFYNMCFHNLLEKTLTETLWSYQKLSHQISQALAKCLVPFVLIVGRPVEQPSIAYSHSNCLAVQVATMIEIWSILRNPVV